MKDNPSISIGNCGEYFVAAELERRGFSVAVPMSNTPMFDLLALERANPSNQIAIQVKASEKRQRSFLLNKKCEDIIGDHIFYVFISLNGMENPEYFIVPSAIVAKTVKERHVRWLETPGRKGQVHNDSSMRRFEVSESDKDAWQLLYSSKTK